MVKKRTKRPRQPCGKRLKGTKYDFQVPNPPYCVLIHQPYSYQDKHGIQYYEANPEDPFVVRQRESGVAGTLYWTLRPIKKGRDKRDVPFPRLGQQLDSLFSLQDGYTYGARVAQDYRLPDHATGWVLLTHIQRL